MKKQSDKSNDEFARAYQSLNAEQREAVDALEGPVMVVAGPGTGKTQMLTLRIAHIIRQGAANPENILALTYTEAGVAAMRERLAQMIGSAGYLVNIHTFHGFCNSVIQEYNEFFPHIAGAEAITETEQARIMQNILEQTTLKLLKPSGDPLHYLRASMGKISELKREGIQPDELAEIARRTIQETKNRSDFTHQTGAHTGKVQAKYQRVLQIAAKNQELAQIYARYQKALREHREYDYDDMILEVLDAVRANAQLRQELQEQFLFILVDEHQDTNNAQNKIVELLCGENNAPNIFIVGDEKQAIYRFQGASQENFYALRRRFPDAKIITLRQNYRSTQNILDAADNILKSPEPLQAQSSHRPCAVKIFAADLQDEELSFIAQDIASKIKAGIEPKDMAILYKENREAPAIADMLAKYDIPFHQEAAKDIFTDPDIAELVALIYAVAHIGDDRMLADALHTTSLNIPPLDVYVLLGLSAREHIRLWNALAAVAGASNYPGAALIHERLQNSAALANAYRLFMHWSAYDRQHSPAHTAQEMLKGSGLLDRMLKEPNAGQLDALRAFFAQIKSLAERKKIRHCKDLAEYLDVMQSRGLKMKTRSRANLNAVHLMTAHGSKGREFNTVYITNAMDKLWGSTSRRDILPLADAVYGESANISLRSAEAVQDDDRRLFYVALTRAKQEAIITYHTADAEGKMLAPTRFIADRESAARDQLEYITPEHQAAAEKLFFSPPPQVKATIMEREYVADLFHQRGLSVSALNNFLECPWKYFYVNLLRYPKIQEAHLLYGTAVHSALQDFFAALIAGKKPGKEFLLAQFKIALEKQRLLSETELAEYGERGNENLSGFFDGFGGKFVIPAAVEYTIKNFELFPDIFINGKIDKIEVVEGKNGVNVVDYKTGNPKSRNEILGTTKTSKGNIYRQLVFYHLLLAEEPQQRYAMVSGEINFIHHDARGKYHQEIFSVTPEDIAKLKDTIREVSDQITTLAFWDQRCEDPHCQYCALRATLR